MISCLQVAKVDSENALGHLQRALEIAVGLKASGRLDPVDEPMIPALREAIAAATSAAG